MKKRKTTAKILNVTAFAAACGFTWGLAVFMLALLTMLVGWGQPFIDLLSSIYIGVDGSWAGALLGLGWAFADGFIGGLIFVLLYNFFAKMFSR